MINSINGKVYGELFEVLKLQENEVKGKIPEEIMEFIKEEALKTTITTEFNSDNILNEISKEAFCVYVYLYTKYVAKGEEKEEIKNLLIENEKEYQEVLRKKYNPDDMFKKPREDKKESEETKENIINTDMVEYKETIFMKIKKMIKKIIGT